MAADDRDDDIPIDVPLSLSGRPLPFVQVDLENQEVGKLNWILPDHCARVNSMGLEPVVW